MRIIYIIAVVLCCSSCEKVIEVGLDNTQTQLVAVATLREGNNPFIVDLSRSGGFYDTGNVEKVSGARVSLQKNNDIPVVIPQRGNGRYTLSAYHAVAGNNYTLKIEQGGNTYTAHSYLPPRVVLDSITYEYQPATVFVEAGYLVYCELDDPAGIKNYYRIKVTLNGRLRNSGTDLFVFNDQLTDGRHIKIPLFLTRFQPKDTLSIELVSLDEKVYKYFETLATIVNTNGQQPAAPANPLTNWSPAILGYFSASSSSRKTIILP